jgi:hypothetical protein
VAPDAVPVSVVWMVGVFQATVFSTGDLWSGGARRGGGGDSIREREVVLGNLPPYIARPASVLAAQGPLPGRTLPARTLPILTNKARTNQEAIHSLKEQP